MHKLGENDPEKIEPRIYRLRTYDEEWRCLYECQCDDWPEMLVNFEAVSLGYFNQFRERVENEEWIWTVEWIEDVEEQEIPVNDQPDSVNK